MAGEKQFKASKKKVDKARKDGKVPKAKEISNFFHVGVLYGALYFLTDLGNELLSSCHKVMRVRDWESPRALLLSVEGLFQGIVVKVYVLLAILFVLTFLSELLQVGMSFSLKRVELKLNNVNPINGLKKIFGEREGMKAPHGLLFYSLELLIFCSVSLLGIYNSSLGELKRMIVVDIEFGLSGLLLESVRGFLLQVVIVIGIYALYKYSLSYRRINKELMMDFDELKQESKEDEGDPHLKGHRKSLQQEVMLHGSIQNVRRAKVLVVSD